MKVVILAGGLGSRLAEETSRRPKPMVGIGGRPILWHIINMVGAHGIREFIIALGYKGEMVKQYFMNYHALNSDLTVDLATGSCTVHDRRRPQWRVHLIDTGLVTQTGGRVRRLRHLLGERETFLLSYGDGVADLDI